MTPDDAGRAAIRNVTLSAALVAYAVLGISVVVRTFTAHTDAPTINGVQAAAFGALAVALGAGYAVMLGVTPAEVHAGAERTLVAKLTDAKLTKVLLMAGAFLYLAVGVAACVAYAARETQTSSVLRTVAIAFGGYVIAYIGSAYQNGS